jgi:hypothetical protein
MTPYGFSIGSEPIAKDESAYLGEMTFACTLDAGFALGTLLMRKPTNAADADPATRVPATPAPMTDHFFLLNVAFCIFQAPFWLMDAC